MSYSRFQAVALGFLLVTTAAAGPPPPQPVPVPGAAKPNFGPEAPRKPAARDADQWLLTLADGYAEAQRLRQPVFLRVGGPDCPWCRKLEVELRKSELKDELVRWSLVSLDADKAADDIKPFSVSGIPALRLLTPTGRLIASHDGFLEAGELAAWLKKNYDAASAVPDPELIATGPPSAEAVGKLVALLKDRDSALREAAVRRLLPYPAAGAAPVAAALGAGPLQTRLAALDLLREWQAPVDGLDPWRPETLAADKLKSVTEWSTHPPVDRPARPLAPADLAAARLDLERMATVTPAEAAAIRERLARHGPALMPDVYARLKNPPSDQARERLTALRYRLVAADTLALNWPGGFERLASDDVRFRHAAIQELARRATAAEEPLLLELFSSPDALVRELSLRILHATAGRQSTAALVKLLGDPEPNVRAAVLKQLADQPTPGMVAQLAAYINQESDADLVVHAVRALRAVDSQESLDALRPLTKHLAWRVRAEAAQAVGEAVTNYRRAVPDAAKAAAFATLIEALDDSDGFVVSRAIAALKKGDRREAVEPLAKLVDRAEPLLAAQAVKALDTGGNTREAALPHLKRFCSHKEPAVRAAAIKELCGTINVSVKAELPAALKDPTSQVRTAAAEGLFQMLNSHRGSIDEDSVQIIETAPAPAPPPQPAMKSGGFFDGLIGLFGGRSDPPPPPQPASQPPPSAPFAPPQPPTDPDKALEEIRSGKGRAKWMADLPPLLEPMLSASDPEERLAAALSLTALGHDDRALPVVLNVAAKVRMLRGRAGGVLTWLPWAKREEIYKKLVVTDPDAEQLQDIINGLTNPRDKRSLPLLWSLTARPGLTSDLLNLLSSKLQEGYFGNDLYSRINGVRPLKPDDVKQAIADAKPKAESGPERQRLIALAVLLSADPDAAKAAAEKIVADESSADGLRRDAFQIRLVAIKQADRRAAEIEGLKNKLAGARRVSVMSLVVGDGALWYLADRGMHLEQPNGGGLVPAVPKEVPADLLRSLIRDADTQTAAAAGFLLALAGDPNGFDALARYWRDVAPKDDAWARMVVRAAAALGDDGRMPVLEEVYVQLPAIGMTPAEFASIIQAMTGPAARRLQAQVFRDQGGNQAAP